MKSYREYTEEEHQVFAGVQLQQAKDKSTVPCFCGSDVSLLESYKCLYCDVWFCEACAEDHFGKTVAEYMEENHVAVD